MAEWKDVEVGDWVKVRLDCDLDGAKTNTKGERVVTEGIMGRNDKYGFAYLVEKGGHEIVLHTTDILLEHRKGAKP